MGRKRAIEELTVPLFDAVTTALDDIGSLRDEMEEWRDNLDNANMSHMPKYEEVSEAVDALDSATDYLSADDTPDILRQVPVRFAQSTKKRMSRGDRMANVTAILYAIQTAVQDMGEKLDDEQDGVSEKLAETDPPVSEEERLVMEGRLDTLDELKGEVEDFNQNVEEVISNAEGVCFPGMY